MKSCRTKSFTGEKGTWVSETMTRLYDKCSVEYKNEIIRDIPFLLSLRKRFEIFQTLVQLKFLFLFLFIC